MMIELCCAGTDLRTEAIIVNRSGVPEGRLRTSDLTALVVWTCLGCGETVERLSSHAKAEPERPGGDA